MTDIDYSRTDDELDMDAVEATLPATNGHVTSTDEGWTIADAIPERPEHEADELPAADVPGLPEAAERQRREVNRRPTPSRSSAKRAVARFFVFAHCAEDIGATARGP